MNKFIQIKNFNGLIDQFFNFLDDSFPDFRSDFILTRSTIEFIRKSNPRVVVEQFMNNIKPFRKYIQECDEDFFINYELSELSGAQSLSRDDFILGAKLKQIWVSGKITEKQKAMVFYYFQKLIQAGELCG
jgi:hypothetical protein